MTDIRPVEPEGFKPIPVKEQDVPAPPPVEETGSADAVDDKVPFWRLIAVWINEMIITEILKHKKGLKMSNDMKSTVAGVVTGIMAIAAVFGFSVPAEWVTVIVSIGVAILGYFTNKKDKE